MVVLIQVQGGMQIQLFNVFCNHQYNGYTVEAAYCGHLGPGTSVRIIRLSRIDGEAQKHTNLILKNPEI